jgi:hypothetical protein
LQCDPASISVIVIFVAVKIIIGWRPFTFRLVLEIKLNRIESHDDKLRTAFFTGHGVALLDFGIDKNFLSAIGTDRSWHVLFSPHDKGKTVFQPITE